MIKLLGHVINDGAMNWLISSAAEAGFRVPAGREKDSGRPADGEGRGGDRV